MHFPAVFKFVRQLQYYVKAHQTHITLIKPLHPPKSKPLLDTLLPLCVIPLLAQIYKVHAPRTHLSEQIYILNISVIVTVVQVFL